MLHGPWLPRRPGARWRAPLAAALALMPATGWPAAGTGAGAVSGDDPTQGLVSRLVADLEHCERIAASYADELAQQGSPAPPFDLTRFETGQQTLQRVAAGANSLALSGKGAPDDTPGATLEQIARQVSEQEELLEALAPTLRDARRCRALLDELEVAYMVAERGAIALLEDPRRLQPLRDRIAALENPLKAAIREVEGFLRRSPPQRPRRRERGPQPPSEARRAAAQSASAGGAETGLAADLQTAVERSYRQIERFADEWFGRLEEVKSRLSKEAARAEGHIRDLRAAPAAIEAMSKEERAALRRKLGQLGTRIDELLEGSSAVSPRRDEMERYALEALKAVLFEKGGAWHRRGGSLSGVSAQLFGWKPPPAAEPLDLAGLLRGAAPARVRSEASARAAAVPEALAWLDSFGEQQPNEQLRTLADLQGWLTERARALGAVDRGLVALNKEFGPRVDLLRAGHEALGKEVKEVGPPAFWVAPHLRKLAQCGHHLAQDAERELHWASLVIHSRKYAAAYDRWATEGGPRRLLKQVAQEARRIRGGPQAGGRAEGP